MFFIYGQKATCSIDQSDLPLFMLGGIKAAREKLLASSLFFLETTISAPAHGNPAGLTHLSLLTDSLNPHCTSRTKPLLLAFPLLWRTNRAQGDKLFSVELQS